MGVQLGYTQSIVNFENNTSTTIWTLGFVKKLKESSGMTSLLLPPKLI